MKTVIAALLLTTSVPAVASEATQESEMVMTVPTAVEGDSTDAEKAAAQLDQMMSFFNKMFDTSHLGPPDPARLKLAEVTAAKLLPDGVYVKIIDDMMGQILKPIFDMMPGLSDTQISNTTGVAPEALAELSEENKAAAAMLIDPNHKKRGEQILAVFKPMIAEAMTIIEPAMRTGLSRAYARKFNAAELATINRFFATPVGESFARESFAVQVDPEVLQATVKAIPAIFTEFMTEGDEFKAKIEQLPKQRKLTDMSEAETDQLAKLLGVSVQSFKDHEAVLATEAAAMVESAAVDFETGDEPWYLEENWKPAERKKVQALGRKYGALSTKSEKAGATASSAFELLEEAQNSARDEARKRYLAEGWKPSPIVEEPVPDEPAADALPPEST